MMNAEIRVLDNLVECLEDRRLDLGIESGIALRNEDIIKVFELSVRISEVNKLLEFIKDDRKERMKLVEEETK